jgi:FAD:protein FMN transferase
VLTSLGVRSALVAVSGDLAFSAAPPGRGGWRIDVHAVPREDTDVPAVLELTHAAVSTSGAGTQHVDIGGRRYSHVIDPASGMGLAGDLTVTVVARDGLTADGLDTAISVLGLDEGMRLVEARPGAAALVVRRGGGGTTVTASARFQALPAAPPR